MMMQPVRNTRPRTLSSNAEYQQQRGRDDEHERELSNQAGRQRRAPFSSAFFNR